MKVINLFERAKEIEEERLAEEENSSEPRLDENSFQKQVKERLTKERAIANKKLLKSLRLWKKTT